MTCRFRLFVFVKLSSHHEVARTKTLPTNADSFIAPQVMRTEMPVRWRHESRRLPSFSGAWTCHQLPRVPARQTRQALVRYDPSKSNAGQYLIAYLHSMNLQANFVIRVLLADSLEKVHESCSSRYKHCERSLANFTLFCKRICLERMRRRLNFTLNSVIHLL